MVYERRKITLLSVVEFWCLHGDLTSEVEVYMFFGSEGGRVKILMFLFIKCQDVFHRVWECPPL